LFLVAVLLGGSRRLPAGLRRPPPWRRLRRRRPWSAEGRGPL